jgi:hypothetical protein
MLLALPFALIACGSDNNGTTGITLASLAGTWSLQTANGAPLPVTIATTPQKTEILSIVENVQANGSFTGTTVTRITPVGGVAMVDTSASSGTFSLSGNLVSITLTGSITIPGTLISATSFSFTDPTSGALFVFVKQ